MTKYFLYAPNGSSTNFKAIAHRSQEDVNDFSKDAPYYLYINANNVLQCQRRPKINPTQEKLCNKINQNGQL